MIEIANSTRMQQAYVRAHQERSKAFVSLFKWLFGSKHVPLRKSALTEPTRCV